MEEVKGELGEGLGVCEGKGMGKWMRRWMMREWGVWGEGGGV